MIGKLKAAIMCFALVNLLGGYGINSMVSSLEHAMKADYYSNPANFTEVEATLVQVYESPSKQYGRIKVNINGKEVYFIAQGDNYPIIYGNLNVSFILSAEQLFIHYPTTTLQEGETYDLVGLRVIDINPIPGWIASYERTPLAYNIGITNLINYENYTNTNERRASIGIFSLTFVALVGAVIFFVGYKRDEKKKKNSIQPDIVV